MNNAGNERIDDSERIVAALQQASELLPSIEDIERMTESHVEGLRLALTNRGTPFSGRDYLVLEQPSGKWTIEVSHLPVSIGSGRMKAGEWKPELILRAKGVSGHHCSLHRDGPFVSIHDDGSKNGTYINGEPVTRQTLCEGDRLHIGEAELVVIRG